MITRESFNCRFSRDIGREYVVSFMFQEPLFVAGLVSYIFLITLLTSVINAHMYSTGTLCLRMCLFMILLKTH